MTEKELRVAFNSYIRDYGKMIGRSTRDMRQIVLLHFTQGVSASDKHWREKTRWKSLLDEPPKLPTSIDKERLILIKHAKGGYDTKFLIKQSSIDMFLRDGFVAWKEID